MQKGCLGIFFLLFCAVLSAQGSYFKNTFTHQDTLRGQLRFERTCYDVTYYELDISLDFKGKSVEGSNSIYFKVLQPTSKIQIDLFNNMAIDKIEMDGHVLDYTRDGNAFFIQFPKPLEANSQYAITVYYNGSPKRALRAPWDGGFVWDYDLKGNEWIGVVCEGFGASSWWPLKDHLSDEPDSMDITIKVPKEYVAVCNGVLTDVEEIELSHKKYHWHIHYPINSYNVTVNVAKYAHFEDVYVAQDSDTLHLDYYVLPENVDTAKKHFQQVIPVLKCYEKYFGKYPFWKDGYCLTETSYLGMEHQSCIAYGNKFKKGYWGRHIPELAEWDYIIVHETGHEYFGNAVSCTDHAEMWLHEAFTTYMESLYTECEKGYDASIKYLKSQRELIRFEEPMVGPLNVNFTHWRGSDIYYKGAWMLHTIRTILGDDVFFNGVRSFYEQYKYKTVTTQDFIKHLNSLSPRVWDAIMEQYLFHPTIPKLQFKTTQEGGGIKLSYRWKANVFHFDMPVKLYKKGEFSIWVTPTTEWQEISLSDTDESDIEFPTDHFLIDVQRVNQNFK